MVLKESQREEIHGFYTYADSSFLKDSLEQIKLLSLHQLPYFNRLFQFLGIVFWICFYQMKIATFPLPPTPGTLTKQTNFFLLVLTGFPPKELTINDANQHLHMLSIKSGDTLIVEENKSVPAVVESNVPTPNNHGKLALRRQ